MAEEPMPMGGNGTGHRWRSIGYSAILLVCCAAAVLTELATGTDVLVPLLVVLPGASAIASHDPWRPVLAGAGALVGCVAAELADGTVSVLLTARGAAIVVGTVTAVISVRAQNRRESRLLDTSAVAQALQQVLVRPIPGRIGALRAEVRYLGGSSYAGVGGDLCDVVSTRYGVRIIIGDVLGKGLPAVQLAADVLGAFRELAHHQADLVAVAARLDSYLTAQAADEDGFATALLLEIPEQDRPATMVHCGHPMPLLLGQGGITVLEPLVPGLPLGLSEGFGGLYVGQPVRFEPGDRLLLYTDGVTEARDAAGTFYPLLDRVRTRLAHDDLAPDLETDLVRHCGGRLHDDATLLLLAKTPDPADAGYHDSQDIGHPARA
jgi:hypothetical protein